MENKKIIIISIIALMIIVGVVIVLKNMNKSYRNELSNSEKTILAEKSYINYAWGFQYSGMAMFNDGTIYKWDFRGSNADYKVNNSKEHGNWILEKGSKVNKKVSEADLDEIEKNIANLENNIDRKNTAYDAGSNSISVWNDDNKEITLKVSGDYTGENKSDNSQKFIKIINKYLK